MAAYVEADNEKARQEALDLLDEERDIAAARTVIYQQDLCCYHSRWVKTRTFQEGDLVLRLIQDQTDNAQVIPTLVRTLCGQQESKQWVILPYRCSRPQGLTHVGGGDPPALKYRSA